MHHHTYSHLVLSIEIAGLCEIENIGQSALLNWAELIIFFVLFKSCYVMV